MPVLSRPFLINIAFALEFYSPSFSIRCFPAPETFCICGKHSRKYGMNRCSACMRFINPCHSGFALVSRDVYIAYKPRIWFISNTSYIPSPLTVHFPITRSVRYQPISHTFYFTLHCARELNNAVLTTVIEMVEILDGRVGKRSVE